MENNEKNYDCLCVTDVKVYPFKETGLGSMMALVNIVLNDQLVLRGLRVMNGENGLFVGYPSDPFYKGEMFRSLFNPVTRQLREHIDNVVIAKYQESLGKEA